MLKWRPALRHTWPRLSRPSLTHHGCQAADAAAVEAGVVTTNAHHPSSSSRAAKLPSSRAATRTMLSATTVRTRTTGRDILFVLASRMAAVPAHFARRVWHTNVRSAWAHGTVPATRTHARSCHNLRSRSSSGAVAGRAAARKEHAGDEWESPFSNAHKFFLPIRTRMTRHSAQLRKSPVTTMLRRLLLTGASQAWKRQFSQQSQ